MSGSTHNESALF
jgi:hypothetical protein